MLTLALIAKIFSFGSPRLWWAIAGLALWALEFLTPADLVLFILGACALVVAIVAPIVPIFWLQLVLWLGLSGAALVALRTLAKRLYADEPKEIEGDTEGETLTAIPPGRPGRVLYEGNSWRALCADRAAGIPSGCKVRIAGRKGNTLMVVLPTSEEGGALPEQPEDGAAW